MITHQLQRLGAGQTACAGVPHASRRSPKALVLCTWVAIAEFIAKADEQIRQNAPPEDKLPEKLESRYSNETKAELKQLRDELAVLHLQVDALQFGGKTRLHCRARLQPGPAESDADGRKSACGSTAALDPSARGMPSASSGTPWL